MNKKEFALSQIAPYFKDPSTCGLEERCKYITSDGRMCVVGKNMLDPSKVDDNTPIGVLLEEFSEEEIFKPEAVGILSTREWEKLQYIHDEIAVPTPAGISHYIDVLGLFTYDELLQYSATL